MTIGDRAEVPLLGPFRLVSLVFNMLASLLSPAHGVLSAALRYCWPGDLDLMNSATGSGAQQSQPCRPPSL